MTHDPMLTPEDRRACYRWMVVIAGVILIFALLAWPRVAKAETLLPHPKGCPARAFCACGACVDLTGSAKACSWRARDWLLFPRIEPRPNAVAVRRSHVFVLKQHVQGKLWLSADYNSGKHKSRLHVRSIAGYVIVDPRARLARVGAE